MAPAPFVLPLPTVGKKFERPLEWRCRLEQEKREGSGGGGGGGRRGGGYNNYIIYGRLWQKTRIEVVCCYVSHHLTVLSPLSHLRRDNQKLVYFLVNSSRLYVLFHKFISRITLTFSFNLTSHNEYIVICGVSHFVMGPRGATFFCHNSSAPRGASSFGQI
jgi:hypothetical protein